MGLLLMLMLSGAARADDVAYGYDALGRLVSVSVAGETAYYDLDAAGNITAIRRVKAGVVGGASGAAGVVGAVDVSGSAGTSSSAGASNASGGSSAAPPWPGMSAGAAVLPAG